MGPHRVIRRWRGGAAFALFAIVVAATIVDLRAGRGDARSVTPGPGSAAYGLGGISRIDPATGAAVTAIDVPRPNVVAFAMGSLWATSNLANRAHVMEVDPRTSDEVTTFDLGYAETMVPSDLAAGFGSVWTIVGSHVYRLDPATGATRRVAGLPSGDFLTGLAVGEGALWALDATHPSVVRIDPGNGRAVARIALDGQPGGIAVAFGSVWVTEPTRGEALRISTAHERVTGRIRLGAAGTVLAAGAGRLWVTDAAGGAVLAVEPSSGAIDRIEVGSAPTGVATMDGSVWVVNSRDATVSRIDPRTMRVAATIGVGPRPYAVAAGGGALWVTYLGDRLAGA